MTDRHRLGPAWETALVEHVREAARAGVHLVQVRERDLDGGPLARLVSSCVEAVRGTGTRVLVNDRLDVALAAGAHGVHLRADSFAAQRARACAPPRFLIGRSVHSLAETLAATEEGATDYLVFGTVFETTSKPGLAVAGVAGLAAAAAATRLPVLAIGGITAARIGEVMAAGASGVAGISMFDTSRRVP
ncbi:MAG TPA: thiamine phosphate synthase [Vicinamibacterales bacterium]|nr:thiamine phosphate synthase [Vicinamibacterales bacterium]